jgi:MYXO-CTERM domain-containing protein
MAYRSRSTIALALALPLSLVPTLARAQQPEEQDEFDAFYENQLLGFEDFGLDTGWIPGGSPVQMRFYASAANTVASVMAGDAYYDWETQQLRFVGAPIGGYFSYDVGVELFAGVKVDVALVKWESDLLGPYDITVDEIAYFLPYLLPENPDRPATIVSQTDGVTIASVPLVPDLLILAGNLDIDVAIDIEASLACNRIEVVGASDEAVFVVEGESVFVDPGEGPEDLELEATLWCQLVTLPSLIVRPHLVMTVGFNDYDIGGIDIPIDLPAVDEEVSFDPVALSFPRPEPPTGDDGGGGTGEDEGGGASEGDTGGDTGGESETGGDPGLDGRGLDDGCNCSTDRSRPDSLLGLGLLALALGLRRRRSP